MSPTKPISPRPSKSSPPAKPAATKRAETFGNYVIHCSTGEPGGLPLNLFCQECETPQEARAGAQRVLDAQRPVRNPSVAWKIIKVEYLGVGLGKGGFGA